MSVIDKKKLSVTLQQEKVGALFEWKKSESKNLVALSFFSNIDKQKI
jgi:hypothetical protein